MIVQCKGIWPVYLKSNSPIEVFIVNEIAVFAIYNSTNPKEHTWALETVCPDGMFGPPEEDANFLGYMFHDCEPSPEMAIKFFEETIKYKLKASDK